MEQGALIKEIEELRRQIEELADSRTRCERLEKTYREESRRFSLIVNNMLNTVAQLDNNGIFVYLSPSHEQIFGFKPENRLGLSAFLFVHPNDQVVVKNVFNHHLISREPSTLEFRYRLGDGTYCWVEASGSVIVNDVNQVEGMIISTRPIEERKRAELALKESEKLYRNVIENIRDVFFRIDREGVIDMISPSGAKLLGFESAESMIGRNLLSDFFADDLQRKKYLKDMDEQGYVDDYEITLRKHDGTIIEASTSSRHDYDRNGAPRGIEGTIRDITLRKQAQEALRASEEKFRTLIESSSVGISITDGERFLYVNPVTRRMSGFSEEEYLSRPLGDFIVPESRELIRQRAKDRLEGKPVPDRYEVSIVAKDGSIKWAEIGAAVIEFNGKQAIIFTQYDITDRKAAEKEKEALQAQLNRAQKAEAVGALAAGIAHDVNNVLSGIQGHCFLLQMHMKPDDPCYQHVQGIENQVRSGAHLTRQLLDMSGGGSYEMKPMDLTAAVNESADVFSRAKKGIFITKQLEEKLWLVEANAGQIDQILLNLFIHAAHAMDDEGQLHLETKNLVMRQEDERPPGMTPGRYVKLSVTDTGSGMDQETVDNAFKPFFTTEGRQLETNLGLASTYGIVKNHRGYITVESKIGAGSTFHIYLPVTEKEIEEKFMAKKKLQRGTEMIMLVDDEAIIAGTTRDILEMLGYRVTLADSGREAIDVFTQKASSIDLVILDMVMPGMGGLEVFEVLRGINPDIGIILYSGYALTDEIQSLIDKGRCGFIQKPFTMEDLSVKIREVIEQKKNPRGGEA